MFNGVGSEFLNYNLSLDSQIHMCHDRCFRLRLLLMCHSSKASFRNAGGSHSCIKGMWYRSGRCQDVYCGGGSGSGSL